MVVLVLRSAKLLGELTGIAEDRPAIELVLIGAVAPFDLAIAFRTAPGNVAMGDAEIAEMPGEAATGTSTGNELGYTGREDDATGMYYYRARYYHPGQQRFLAEDPIGFKAGDPNFYGYVGNNPVSFRDPHGLFIDPVTTAVAIVTFGALVGLVVGGDQRACGNEPECSKASRVVIS
jgi:RHS repeat-associated protein